METIHSHTVINAEIASTEDGIRAIKWSFVGLFVTALFQVIVVAYSGSVALLADTIHNIGDAATAVPLWIAFRFSGKIATKRFTYGYGRLEDLAGVLIVFIILFSAVYAGYEAVNRLLNPAPVRNLWAVAVASVIGFIGNEAVALLRIRTGKRMGSAALVADGYHARVDGLTSLAVFLGAAGVWLGYPLADPVIGLVITLAILKIVYDSGKPIFTRLIDGIDPAIVDEIQHTANHDARVKGVTEIRARWLGHRLYAELGIIVDPSLTVDDGDRIAAAVGDELMSHLGYLADVRVLLCTDRGSTHR